MDLRHTPATTIIFYFDIFIEFFLYVFSKFFQVDHFFWMAIFFWFFQFQLQIFTLNTGNSDKTKSWKADCDLDLTNLTPVAGLIFETKNREIFLERFFWREITAREQVSRAVILEKFQVIQ